MALNETNKPFYRPQLDVVRGLAFLCVYVHHAFPRTGVTSHLRSAILDASGFGLSLFFVLSAYLITLLLLREKQKTGNIQLRLFYIRRALRIWPLSLLGLAIGLLFDHSGWHIIHGRWYLAALIMCGNVATWQTAAVGHLWSISIEEQFYLLFPAAMRKLSPRGICYLALVMILSANLALARFTHVHADLDTHVWSSTLVGFEMFAAGILLALADKNLPAWSQCQSLVAACTVPVVWFAVAYLTPIKRPGTLASDLPILCVAYALVAVACCVLITAVQKLKANAFGVWLGTLSYGLYVYHIPMIRLFHSRSKLAFLPTLLCAALSYRFLESPLLKMKKRFEVVASKPVNPIAVQRV
ncbi:MAG: acyltransferase family protein [Janthinobacterium lividum]